MADDLSTLGSLPPAEGREAMYEAWRQRMAQRVERNRRLLEGDGPPPLADEWRPERLFEESRRLAEAERWAS